MKLGKEGKFVLVALAFISFGSFVRYFTENVGYLVVTTSPSLDHRVFWMNLRRKEPKIGEYVAIWLEGDKIVKVRHRSLKQVVCGPGDLLEVKGKDYYCNGKYLGRAKDRSLTGIPVDNFKFNGRIPEGYYFLMGSHKDSYDSRYYGLVRKERFLGVAKPLL